MTLLTNSLVFLLCGFVIQSVNLSGMRNNTYGGFSMLCVFLGCCAVFSSVNTRDQLGDQQVLHNLNTEGIITNLTRLLVYIFPCYQWNFYLYISTSHTPAFTYPNRSLKIKEPFS